MKKNGFTLVELLAVLIVLALLMAIAIPSALRISNSVKEKAYNTKIDLIEEAAKNYGQSNLTMVKEGKEGENDYQICQFKFVGEDMEFDKKFSPTGNVYDESATASCTNCYYCLTRTVADLVDTGNLNWDDESYCDPTVNPGCADKVIFNPKTKGIINNCSVYIYYKNKRVYSFFDKRNCEELYN